MTGLHRMRVSTYSVGIAIPQDQNRHGLTQEEIRIQKEQLLNFANGDPDRVMDLGSTGFELLDKLADQLVATIPFGSAKLLASGWAPAEFWCGWSTYFLCESQEFPQVKQQCKWVSRLPDKPRAHNGCVSSWVFQQASETNRPFQLLHSPNSMQSFQETRSLQQGPLLHLGQTEETLCC